MDYSSRAVYIDGGRLWLRPKEFAVLEALMRHPDRALSRTVLSERVWGTAYAVSDNAIDVTISGLRQKLADGLESANQPADSVQITTVRGIGYQLVEST